MFHQNIAMERRVGSVLRQARKQRGYVLRQVAEVAGVSTAAVGQWERDENDLTMENLRKVATFLGIDPLAANRGELRYTDKKQDLSDVERVTDAAPVDMGPEDVEILGVSVGGDDGDFALNGQIVGYARRPAGIARIRNVFAVHVIGESMVPRYEPADLLYCGGRAPVPGDDVVIEMFPKDDETVGKAYIKRLVRRTASEIVCKQFNPAMEMTFNPYEMKAMHRVIPYRELLGY